MVSGVLVDLGVLVLATLVETVELVAVVVEVDVLV